ncbi:hypothetical protein BGW41_007667 [Actinomortierella wolfii]|nr:hypothetical protein BGW41_007667 [Actinomortierella wolfii]
MNMVEPSSILSSQQPDPVFVMDSRATSKKPSSHSKRSNVPMSKERFSKQDFERIEIWLEQLPNLSSVFDIGGQTSIGLLNRPSAQENTKLAQVISNQSKDRQNLNTKAARERLDRFRRTDIAVKEKSKTTIFGITNEDRNSDIYTMAQKPESMRTSDVKLDALFEHRPKFTPLSTYTGGLALLKESRKANRVSQRQRRLLDEESEYEEEGGDEDRGERSHEEVEVIPDSSQILGGRDNEVINNNAAGDTRDLHDSTFDGEFRKDADGISDVNGQDTAQEIGLDPANDTTGEEISELSISTQLLFQPRQQKRQSTDQPQQQNKRPRPSGSRHISMSLHSSSLKLSRRTVWSSYEQKIIREVEGKVVCNHNADLWNLN